MCFVKNFDLGKIYNTGKDNWYMLKKPGTIDISLHKIYSEDNLELDAILFKTKASKKKVIVHIHGKEGHFIQNHFVTMMGYQYPLEGYSFLTFNNRGHDYMADMLQRGTQGFEWVKKGTAFDLLKEVVLDINGVVSYLIDLGFEEIILQGHSVGPHKICYYMANQPKYDISKIILLSTADIIYILDAMVPNWRKYSKLAEEMIKKGKGKELMPITLWSEALVCAETFWDFTNEESDSWIFNFKEPEREFKYFNQIKETMLVVNPENDVAVGTRQDKVSDLLRKNTVSRDFRSVVIKNAIHNFASKETELVTKIVSWLKVVQ